MSKEATPQNINTPANQSVHTPPPMQASHDFTLQTVMELQKSSGEILSTLDSLKGSIEKLDKKLDKSIDKLEKKSGEIERKISKISHAVVSAGAVLLVVLSIGGFILNKSWDSVVKIVLNQSTHAPLSQQIDENKSNLSKE